jgi:hypothetical protein
VAHPAHRALVAAAARWLPEPAPTSWLRIDETRSRSVPWVLGGLTWKRVEIVVVDPLAPHASGIRAALPTR